MKIKLLLFRFILLMFTFLYIISCEENTEFIVQDIDGNNYHVVMIGNQVWMVENLKVTKFRNGEPISFVADETSWKEMSIGAYCNYDHDASNANTYGLLYNWHALSDPRNIAPEGWHIPSDEEWKELEMYLGMNEGAADSDGWRGSTEALQLKASSGWISDNGTNSTGFSALPGGCREPDVFGFAHMGSGAFFWTSSWSGADSFHEYAWIRVLWGSLGEIERIQSELENGYSIRCLRD